MAPVMEHVGIEAAAPQARMEGAGDFTVTAAAVAQIVQLTHKRKAEGKATTYDLAFVADSQDLVAFDRVPAEERPAWLHRFWEDRDIESLRPRGSRLREHYRRIGVARDSFRILSYPRQYELNELWVNRDAEYDDRGLMYIRHGPPDLTADAVRAGACPILHGSIAGRTET